MAHLEAYDRETLWRLQPKKKAPTKHILVRAWQCIGPGDVVQLSPTPLCHGKVNGSV